MMGGVGTQGSTQTIINAVQKRIFVFKSLPISKSWLRSYCTFSFGTKMGFSQDITNAEKIYGNLTFWKPAQLGKPGSAGNFPVVHGIRPRHYPDILWNKTFLHNYTETWNTLQNVQIVKIQNDQNLEMGVWTWGFFITLDQGFVN